MVKLANEAPQSYDYPKYSDFWIPIVISKVYVYCHNVMVKFLKNVVKPYCKDQNDPNKLEVHSKKVSSNVFNGFYMTYLSALGYYVLKDQVYFPKYLGGSGDYSIVFRDHPYPSHAPYLKVYYISVTSYHLA